jgi:hypothetical protein
MHRFSPPELEAALAPPRLSRARLLQAAFVLAPLALLLVVTTLPPEATRVALSDDVLGVLSMLDAGVLFVVLGSVVMLETRVREAALERAVTAEDGVAALQRLSILRLALLEGAALFGVAVLFLGALSGRLEGLPLLWWNAVPFLALLGVALGTFPSRERFLRAFEK